LQQKPAKTMRRAGNACGAASVIGPVADLPEDGEMKGKPFADGGGAAAMIPTSSVRTGV